MSILCAFEISISGHMITGNCLIYKRQFMIQKGYRNTLSN